MLNKTWITGTLLLALLLALPITAGAQDELPIDVTQTVDCDSATFAIDLPDGSAPYKVKLEFGDAGIEIRCARRAVRSGSLISLRRRIRMDSHHHW
jgi:hypothetical protein